MIFSQKADSVQEPRNSTYIIGKIMPFVVFSMKLCPLYYFKKLWKIFSWKFVQI